MESERLQAICLRANLVRAFQRAARGKGSRADVRAFAGDLDQRLASLGRDVRRGTLAWGGYRAFGISDGKRRTIHAPPFAQRVAHHAILNVCREDLEERALPSSFAGRPGRGLAPALHCARRYTRRGVWFLKMDIASFYDRVPHQGVLDVVCQRIADPSVRRLFAGLVDSYQPCPGRGLPMGALSSQVLANAFLDPLDHLLHEPETSAIRYLDDFFFWSLDRDRLLGVRDRAVTWLGSHGLAIQHGGCLNRCTEGVPFLGFVVFPGWVRLSAKARKRSGRRYRALRRDFQSGKLDEEEATERLTALFAWMRQADSEGWRRALLARQPFGDVQTPPRDAGRQLRQSGVQLSVGLPQQEAGGA